MAASRSYIFVVVDRDFTPDLATKFNVSAYPSFIVLNKDQEKVLRFQAFMKPPDFLGQLGEGLKRYALYTSGQEWDEPNPRAQILTVEATVTTMNAPLAKPPSGLAFLKRDLWVAYMGTLYQLNGATGAVKQNYQVERSITDLATDGKVLYGVESGWTAGKPIHVIDPATGKDIRQIVTQANLANKFYGAFGITWRKGKLYVVEGGYGKISEIDPKTGDISRTITTKEHYVSGLDFDGEHFVLGNRNALLLINPETGETVRRVPMNYPLRIVKFWHGAYYVMEQSVFGFSKDHKTIQVWPRQGKIYRLTLLPAPPADARPAS